MAFKSDAQGFLVGELIKTNDHILTAQQDASRSLARIRTDVSAIARAINAQSKASQRSTSSGQGGQRVQRVAPIAPAGRSGGRTAGGNQTTGPARAAAQAKGTRAATAAVAVVAARDVKGRFVKGAGKAAETPDEKGDKSEGGSNGGGFLSRIADGIGRLSAAAQTTDNIDPTVNAMKEVTDVVTPLGRGLFSMFGRSAERKKERWYQRIYKALTNPVIGKRQEPAAGGGGGIMGTIFGGIGRMLGSLPTMLMGLLSRILLPIAAAWGAWELGQWIGGKIYAWLDESGWNTKLFDAVDAIKETFSNAWSAVGNGIDTFVNGIKDTWKSITDGFQSALDSFGQFPKKIGEFFSGLDESMRNLPVIGKAYAAAADAAKSVVADAKQGFTEGKDGKTSAPAGGAVQAIARDVGKGVAAATEVGSQAKAGYQEARGQKTDAPAPTGIVSSAARKVGGAVGGVVQAGSNANMMLQAGREAGMSNKELANFMGQNAHESGGFRTLNENLNYSAGGLRKTFGKYYKTDAEAQADANNPEAIANKVYGGRMGNTEAGDGYKFRGRGFTQLTGKSNYSAAGKALGLDLVNNPDLAADPANAAKISAWYWKNNVSKRGAGEDVTKATKLVNGGYIGLEDRQKKAAEWEAKIAAGAGTTTTNAANAGLPTPAAASVPAAVPQQLPEQAKNEVPDKLNAGAAAGAKVQVNLKDKTSQNIGDRGIAHIVTGGMGS